MNQNQRKFLLEAIEKQYRIEKEKLSDPIIQHRFSWWHKGLTKSGNTMRPSGHVWVVDDKEALDILDKMLRKKWPDVQWMRGKDVETDKLRYGPVVRRLKQTREKPAS